VIKVPLYLPYITGTASFERYNGSIEVNGFFYNYVAKAITNDTLVLVCMPNNLQTRLSNATKEYAGIISTIQNKSTQNSNSAVLLLKLLKAEYNQEPVPYPSYIASIVTGLNKVCDDNTVCDVLISSPDEPPEIAQRYSNFYC
jgi:hypothetical protein